MKTACIYHSVDLDGWMSAAIVKNWFIQNNKEYYIFDINQMKPVEDTGEFKSKNMLDFYGYNYGQPIPDLSEYDKVIMCDISFPKEEMNKLSEPLGKLVWIDHHKSAMLENASLECKGWRDVEFAACELTWKYFFPNNPMPEIVRLLGLYDSFRHKSTDEEQKVLEFQYGARQVITNYEEAYKYLLESFKGVIYYDYVMQYTIIDIIYENGKNIYQYLCTEAKQIYKSGFTISLPNITIPEEEYVFLCINKERFNPINFGIDYHKDGYDGCACFHYADGVWNFSLYNDNGLVDCSLIAKQFGGGGHKGAAGFRLPANDITKFLNNG